MRGLVVFILFFSQVAKADSLWQDIKNYYQQTIESMSFQADIAKFYWSLGFKEKIQPKIIKGYELYYDTLGSKISDQLYTSYKFFKPKLDETLKDTNQYYQDNHTVTYRYLTDVPAFIKIAYEEFIFKIWQGLDYVKDNKSIDKYKQAISLAESAVKAKNSNKFYKENRYLNDLVNEIKYSTYDYGMQDCYKAYVVDLDILNAFNTGCSVFVTKEMLKTFEGDRDGLRAVLAHELAHGDRGHNLKTLLSFLGTGVKHYSHFSLEWLNWLVTGDKNEFYKLVDKKHHLNLIMESFSEKAPALELDADKVGAEILMRAGYKKQDLMRALKVLHRITEDIDCNKKSLKGSHRNYPNLCSRLKTIEDVSI